MLSKALRLRWGIETFFLTGDPSESTWGARADSPVERLGRRSHAELCAVLAQISSRLNGAKPNTVLLHYVNYGYEIRGCPYWLIAGLRAWRSRDPRNRLVTMFHELYASGPLWRSSFWLSRLQRQLAATLCGISSAVVTNRELSRQWLSHTKANRNVHISVMPVFSNLGESECPKDWWDRAPQLVVLGGMGVARRAYGACRTHLLDACKALNIEEIVDVGERVERVPARIGNISVISRGYLTPSRASAVLSRARAGFVDYPSDYLGKSSVFAAYAAHGVLPIVSRLRGTDEAGLQEGFNYWVASPGDPRALDFEAIATNAAAWYMRHRLDVQARHYASLLFGA